MKRQALIPLPDVSVHHDRCLSCSKQHIKWHVSPIVVAWLRSHEMRATQTTWHVWQRNDLRCTVDMDGPVRNETIQGAVMNLPQLRLWCRLVLQYDTRFGIRRSWENLLSECEDVYPPQTFASANNFSFPLKNADYKYQSFFSFFFTVHQEVFNFIVLTGNGQTTITHYPHSSMISSTLSF